MTTKNPFLSVIVPLYNEQSRLRNLINIYRYLNQQKFDYEVILVDDGSKDNTIKQLAKLSKKFKFQLITYLENRGKGYAIKTGMLAAKGKFRLFLDTDLSTPIEEFNKFFPYLSKNNVLVGSRKIKGSYLKKRQPLLRESLGKVFTLLSQRMLNLFVSDFTCGFKCFSKKAAESIFIKQKIRRWGFDPEVLFIAKQLKFSIKEIPIRWRNDPRTKVKFPQDLISSFLDLIKIRYYHIKGYYDKR